MTEIFKNRHLSEVLVARGYVASERLAVTGDEDDRTLGERLLRDNVISQEQLAESIAEQSGLPYVNLDDFIIPSDLYQLIPVAQAYRLRSIPYAETNGVLQAVVSDPFDPTLIDKLERLSGMHVEILVSSQEAVTTVLKRSESSSELLKDASEDFKLILVKETDEGTEETVTVEDDDKASPVIKLVNRILMDALQKRSSDIHIEVYESELAVKYRIDGVLYPATGTLDPKHHRAMVSRLKVMAELDIAEKRIPQDGRFKLRLSGRDIDFRVSILPSVYGEDVVIRILDKSSISDGVKQLNLDGLGFDCETLDKLRRSISEPYGMVLITGPTGSGKTTTLYGALSEINGGEEKIITIEDPVEYQLKGIVQIPVNEKKGLTFSKGLRSILRHDPDKIMVGEIRDSDTVQIAVQSALTGHLVFTTVHANNAFDVIGRLSHMGVDVYSFVSALNCVMAQRLVRKICPKCKKGSKPTEDELLRSGFNPADCAEHTWYEGAGCEYCGGTGYRGRDAIAELLVLTPKIREMIVNRHSIMDLERVAKEEGMTTLRQSAIKKALAGETTLREINRVTFVE